MQTDWVKAVVDAYLHRIRWRPFERSLEGRRKCIRPAGGGTGDCTRSYRGWALWMTENIAGVLEPTFNHKTLILQNIHPDNATF